MSRTHDGNFLIPYNDWGTQVNVQVDQWICGRRNPTSMFENLVLLLGVKADNGEKTEAAPGLPAWVREGAINGGCSVFTCTQRRQSAQPMVLGYQLGPLAGWHRFDSCVCAAENRELPGVIVKLANGKPSCMKAG